MLIDISEEAKKLGFGVPIAATFELYIHNLNYTERTIFDLLGAVRCLAIKCDFSSSAELGHDLQVEVPLGCRLAEEHEFNDEDNEFIYGMLKIKVVYHRGDDNKPVITLRYPDEPWDKRERGLLTLFSLLIILSAAN